jgi:hypothetical protein
LGKNKINYGILKAEYYFWRVPSRRRQAWAFALYLGSSFHLHGIPFPLPQPFTSFWRMPTDADRRGHLPYIWHVRPIPFPPPQPLPHGQKKIADSFFKF